MSSISESAAAPHLLGLGDVATLEARVAAHFEMRYAVAMPSATTAFMALGLALDMRGQTFLTTPLTYGGTVAAWLALGAVPHFADVEGESLALSAGSLARSVTQDARAILAVDLFGYPCDDEALRREADRRSAWLIVDAAQSLGARRQGRASGSAADAVVVSFTSGKALDVGEGGAVVTNSRDIYERLIWHSQHPYRQQRELGLRRTNGFAINGRIHPLAARAAHRRFNRAMVEVAGRRVWAEGVRSRMASVEGVKVPLVERDFEPSYYRLTFRGSRRASQAAVAALSENGENASASPLPVSLLYRQTPLNAQMRRWSRICTTAARESRGRFCLSPVTLPFTRRSGH